MIVCEGPDDVFFLSNLISNRGLSPFHIRHTGTTRYEKGGITKFEDTLKANQLTRGFSQINDIVLVADADDDREYNFRYVCEQVSNAGLSPPETANKPGPKRPFVWVVILPFSGAGTLESYCLQAARSVDENTTKHCDMFCDFVTNGRWPEPKKDKLWIRAMLAAHCKRDPMVNFGVAIDDPRFGRPVPFGHSSFDGLVAILNRCG